jgi:NitT/TauT family transport system ATP-binding protein
MPDDAPAIISTTNSVVRLRLVGQVFTSRDGQRLTALDDIALDVGRHEFIAIIGPSGCGKSTILRLVAGLLKPSSGTVSVYGRVVDEPRDDIGIVFQRPTLLPWLKVLDNVTFPVKHKTGRVDEASRTRARALLHTVGLADFATRRPDELSGGMQQRVAIARALLQDPDILLMDEPFSALDALTRDEMALELLRIMDQTPKTVLFVTHSIPEALLLADRIVVLSPRPGRVQDILSVPFPRPRGLETMTDPLFNTLANEIRQQVFTRKPA